MAKRFRIFNSLGVISLLVLAAMVLTMITGAASADRDPHVKQKSLIHSHLAVPAGQPDASSRLLLRH